MNFRTMQNAEDLCLDMVMDVTRAGVVTVEYRREGGGWTGEIRCERKMGRRPWVFMRCHEDRRSEARKGLLWKAMTKCLDRRFRIPQ